MNLFINTLAIGSMSGEHVVYGFLRPLLANLGENDQVSILHYAGQLPPEDITALKKVTTHRIDNRYRHWALRAVWEIVRLPALARLNDADLVLNVSGAITPYLKVPQVSLAMNPWCYVEEARSGWVQAFKAFVQRRGHRQAFRSAAHMVYISRHLRDLYRQANRDCLDDEAPSTIAYVGLDDALFDRAQALRSLPRKPHSILSVSAFAPWKGVENVVEAVHLLRQSGVPATLDLAGPWPEPGYHEKVRLMVGKLGLEQAVTIHGKVSVEALHRLYATHQVYCLMSSSESFGIPAAEAMAFGTPVVSSDCCAIAEVCDRAGLFGPLDDPDWTARALRSLLTDPAAWFVLSETAKKRAAKLTWVKCATPLLEILGLERPAMETFRDAIAR